MKKLLLLATIGVAGLMSAENSTSKNKKETNSKDASKISKKATTVGQCVTYFSTCGVTARTCATDGWGFNELQNWGNTIENNYCAPNAPFSNNSGLEP